MFCIGLTKKALNLGYLSCMMNFMKPLSKLIPSAMTPAAKKRGLVSARIILDWEKIVGPQYAEWSAPQKISFRPNQRNKGTLHLSVNPAHALLITHSQDLLLAKINMYFGYEAVSKVTMIQVPFQKKKTTDTKLKSVQIEHSEKPQFTDVNARINQALKDLESLMAADKSKK